jgi:hypothetical protein
MTTRPPNLRPRSPALIDPFAFQRRLWPQYALYDKQREIVRSTEEDDETYVTAGNMLGKDFLAGLIPLLAFLRCLKLGITCRIVTHSVAEHHLLVMWGEIGRFISSSKVPLLAKHGGPLVVNHMEVRRADEADMKNPLSYLVGRVSEKGEGLAGHHAEYTMFIGDEASGLDDVSYEMAQGWAKRMYLFGNPNAECANFWRTNIEAGDVPREGRPGYHRRVLKITAEDSPNVKYARAQQAAGLEPDDTIVVPGVLTWEKYQHRRKTWTPRRQAAGLDAVFYAGPDAKMFPPDWLRRARNMAELYDLKGAKRTARGIGVDPAEGGDNTAIAVVDEHGLLDLRYAKTPDTSSVKGQVLAMMRKWNVPPERVCFDRGGGGKQHADYLRAAGYGVKTVGFGSSIEREPQRGMVQPEVRAEDKEQRYAYKDRRAQLYHALRLLLDPYEGLAVERPPLPGEEPLAVSRRQTFALPERFRELFDELAPIPFTEDVEGVVYLIPKDKPNPNYKGPTLKGLIGHSPDLADALVLAVFAMQQEELFEITAG